MKAAFFLLPEQYQIQNYFELADGNGNKVILLSPNFNRIDFNFTFLEKMDSSKPRVKAPMFDWGRYGNRALIMYMGKPGQMRKVTVLNFTRSADWKELNYETSIGGLKIHSAKGPSLLPFQGAGRSVELKTLESDETTLEKLGIGKILDPALVPSSN